LLARKGTHSVQIYAKLSVFTVALAMFAYVRISPTKTKPPAVTEGPLAIVNEPALPEVAWPNSILDLQPSRQTSSNRIRSDKGLQGTATLVNLNPAVNTWYLLEVDWQDGSKFSYHLENPKPRSQKLVLDAKSGIELVEGDAHRSCAFFGGGGSDALEQAK